MRKSSPIRREAILAAAAQEFSKCGYDGASIAAIAGRLGSSKPTIYRYFPSKEELFASVTSHAVAKLMGVAEEALQGSEDLRQALVSYGCRYLAFRQSAEAIDLTRLVFGESGRSDIGRHIWNGVKMHGVRKVVRSLGLAIEKGKLRDADPLPMALHLFALFDAELVEPVVWRAREPASPQEIEAIVGRAVEAFVNAYRPDDGSGGGDAD